MQRHACILFAFVAYHCILSATLLAETPASQQAETHLQNRLTVTWQGQHLSAVLNRLADTQSLTFWLDRRVNPRTPIEASFNDLPLQQVLIEIAEQHELGITLVDDLVYVGPKQSAQEITTLILRARDSLDKASSSTKRRWLESEQATWPHLSQPRELLAELLEEASIDLAGSEAIPHDLWSAKRLPSLSLVEKTVLLLVGFDLACKISLDGNTCQVVPIERPVMVTRPYRLLRNQKLSPDQLKQLIPEALVKMKGRKLSVTARWEDHLQLQQLLSGKRSQPTKGGTNRSAKTEKLYTLQLKNQPVGAVIRQFGQQLKLSIDWDFETPEAATRGQEALVSCNVKNVPLDELLKSVLEPASLKFRREGTTITIHAAP